MEIWRDIKGFNGAYKVSNLGNVYSDHKKSEKKQSIDEGGYHLVILYLNGKQHNCLVHRLVAEAFIDKPDGKDYVNHKDGNKSNNEVSNLEWTTRSENEQHAYDTGLRTVGEDRYNAKLSNEDVEWIKENYIPRHKEFGQSAIARKFGVSQQNISNIVNGKRWKHGGVKK